MKTIYISFTFLAIITLLVSCEEDNPHFKNPSAEIGVSAEVVNVLESVIFTNLSDGQDFSVFPGDEGHEFGKPGDIGIPFASDTINYSYKAPGTYKVTMVANGFKINGKELESDTISKTITVIDSVSKIDFITFETKGVYMFDRGFPQYFIYQSSPQGANMICPIFHYSSFIDQNTDKPISDISKIKLVPTITKSLGVDVTYEVEGESEFINGKTDVNHLNESQDGYEPKQYTLVTRDKLNRVDYLVCPMTIPQFITLRLDGSFLPVKKNRNDYLKFDATLTVADSVDITSMVAEFTMHNDDIEIKIGDVIQESGVTANDFTKPVVYTLTYRQPGYEDDFVITSEVTVTVSREENE